MAAVCGRGSDRFAVLDAVAAAVPLGAGLGGLVRRGRGRHDDYSLAGLWKIKMDAALEPSLTRSLPAGRRHSGLNQVGGPNMPDNNTELDQMQATYVAAVEQWIDAIRQEEALASVNHTIAEVDK